MRVVQGGDLPQPLSNGCHVRQVKLSLHTIPDAHRDAAVGFDHWSKPTAGSLWASGIVCKLNFTCRTWQPLESGCGKSPPCTTRIAHEQVYPRQAWRELGKSRPHIRGFTA